MEDIILELRGCAREYGFELDGAQLAMFRTYMDSLLEWNEKVNLTSITAPREVAVKHFLDSMLVLKYLKLPEGASVIDVGTGAGFPGLPMKILRPDLNVTLLDSLNKRLVFLSDILKKLNVECRAVHARAEEYGRKKENREAFGFAVSRAVARLPALCEYCLPFIKKGGFFAAMKGPDIEEELKSAANAVSLLGCEVSAVEKYNLPNGDGRSMVIIRRVRPLPEKYPRRGVKIVKNPLG